MKETPLLMCTSMIQAYQSGIKTQTRRQIRWNNSLVDGQRNRNLFVELDWRSPEIFVDKGPSPAGNPGPYLKVPHKSRETVHRVYPMYQLYENLWLRETWGPYSWDVAEGWMDIKYKADSRFSGPLPVPNNAWLKRFSIIHNNTEPHWIPAMFMPRWACRYAPKIIASYPERLGTISEQNVMAEGIHYQTTDGAGNKCYGAGGDISDIHPVRAYKNLWNAINGPKSWEKTEFVWVIKLEKCEKV